LPDVYENAELLRSNIKKLPEGRREFASSLCDAALYGKPSPKQALWIEKLLDVIDGNGRAPAPTAPTSFPGIIRLFDRAGEALKAPRVLLDVDGQELRLTIAGRNSSAPGAINVTSSGDYEKRVYYGRVARDGTFWPSRDLSQRTLTAICAALQAVSEDPAHAIAKFGKLTGKCACCGLPLSDPRSLAVGYGKVCAERFRLPWGTQTPQYATPEKIAEKTRQLVEADKPIAPASQWWRFKERAADEPLPWEAA
jgi:hypothetical protein